MKTKEELEHQIAMLTNALESGKAHVVDYENDLATAKKKLEDINKPEITPLQFDKIQEAIEEGVGNFALKIKITMTKSLAWSMMAKYTLKV